MASERVQRRIDRLLDQVEEAADGQDWPRVRELCEEVLGLDPDNPDAPAFQSAAERRLGGSDAVSAEPGPAGSRRRGEEAPVAPSAIPNPEVPTSFADGRYMVKSFLGEGGNKRVYLAHDELLDRDVAFALIKTEGLDDTSRQRISHEAQAMGRLGSLPHIVTVFDLGEHPSPATGGLDQGTSQPLMVTELMAGGKLRP